MIVIVMIVIFLLDAFVIRILKIFCIDLFRGDPDTVSMGLYAEG